MYDKLFWKKPKFEWVTEDLSGFKNNNGNKIGFNSINKIQSTSKGLKEYKKDKDQEKNKNFESKNKNENEFGSRSNESTSIDLKKHNLSQKCSTKSQAMTDDNNGDDNERNKCNNEINKLLQKKKSGSFLIDPLQKKEIVDKKSNQALLTDFTNGNKSLNPKTDNKTDNDSNLSSKMNDSFLNPKSANLSSIKDLSLNSKGHTQPDDDQDMLDCSKACESAGSLNMDRSGCGSGSTAVTDGDAVGVQAGLAGVANAARVGCGSGSGSGIRKGSGNKEAGGVGQGQVQGLGLGQDSRVVSQSQGAD